MSHWARQISAAAAAVRATAAGVQAVAAGAEVDARRIELRALLGSDADVLRIAAAVGRLSPFHQRIAQRAAVELVKGGLTADQVIAFLPSIFYDRGAHEPLPSDTAQRRAELVVALVNTFGLGPDVAVFMPIAIRFVANYQEIQ